MKRPLYVYAGLFMWVLMSTAACDNAIVPLADDAESFVFINGFLDMASDSQLVRLNGLRPSILADPRTFEGVQVKTLDLTASTEIVWSDSSIVLDSGETSTVYTGLFRPEEGHIYDFVVQRPGFDPATARTSLPEEPVIFVEEPQGNNTLLSQQVWLNGLQKSPHSLDVAYDVFIPETGEIQRHIIGYGQNGNVTPNGWQFEVFLVRDQEIINFSLGRESTAPPLGLRRIATLPVVESAEWDTKQNPKNLTLAHGFFGSVGRFDLSWILSTGTVEKMGFVDEQDLPLAK